MWRKKKDLFKRRMLSGVLACLLVATTALNTVGVISSLAAESGQKPRISYKNHGKQDIQISILSENESYAPGAEISLKIYVQNNTDQFLEEGSLRWTGKDLEEAGFPEMEAVDWIEFEDGSWWGVGPGGTPSDADQATPSNLNVESDGRRIRNIQLAPGEIYETEFYGYIKENLENIKDRKISFSFTANKENGGQVNQTQDFTYNTGMTGLLPIEFEDGNEWMTNEKNTMYIRTRFEEEHLLEEFDREYFTGSSSEGNKATPSDAGTGTPSNAQRDTDFDGESIVSTATVSDAAEEGTDPKNIRYSIETYGAQLKGITAWYDEEESRWGETAIGVSFRVAEKTKPGIYFGKVTTSIRRNGKSYETTQGFCFYVLGEGELVMKSRINGAEVEVRGPRDSFPEGDVLSLKVSEVAQDKMELVQEAMAQKAEELGVSVDKMKAMDIKIIADGEERELEGEVQVTFSNLKLEKVEIAAAANEDPESEVDAPVVFGMRMARAQKAESAPEESAEIERMEGEEQEESSLAVWHLDEDAEMLNDMDEVVVEDDGDVVMTTDHFSIYIVVNVAGGQKMVPVTVTHYAKVKKYETISGARDYIPYSLKEQEVVKNGQRFMYPGAKDAAGNYEEGLIEIYSPDTIELPNGGGTGIGYSILVDSLSKLSLGGNYIVKSVTVTNENYPQGQTFSATSNSEIRLAGTGNEIRIEYERTTGSIQGDVEFHDYNVSVPGVDGKYHHTVNTQNQGINDPSLCQGTTRVGVGIKGQGDAHVWYSWSGETAKKQGIVKDSLAGKLLQFNASDPGLFTRGDIKVGNNIAKKYITDHTLEFKREGDTYTLSGVYRNGNQICSGLDTLKYTGPSWGGKANLYSNLFWPLDSYGDYTGKDPLFPGGSAAYGREHDPEGKGIENFHGTTGFTNNDETRIGIYEDHNWFFGMRYDFEFTLGDYIGPLDYYFRGDDDFWLYIDGNLVKDAELSGIHSAEGAFVDLKTYLEGKNAYPKSTDSEEIANSKKSATHTMSVFFMERGGTGSCCYMQFTLPNIVSIPSVQAETVSRSVSKLWEDGSNEHAVRPTEVFVQLLQNGKPFGGTEKLNEDNGWSYTWNNLPKYRYVGSNVENTYAVKEIEVPGYESVVTQNGTNFTITNIETTYIKVEKEWNNEAWNDPGVSPGTAIPSSIQVQLEKRVDGSNTWVLVGGPVKLQASSDLTLNWKYGWPDMPLYEKVGNQYKKVEYRVTEVEDEWLKTVKRPDGWYVASATGDEIEGFILTNTYKPENISKRVKKIWTDEDNKFELRPEQIEIQLKRNGIVYRESLILNEANNWEGEWNNLPKYYYVKENGKVVQKSYLYTVEELENFQNAAYYNASYTPVDTSQTSNVTITNTLKTAQFRVAKRIDNYEAVSLDHNDLLEDEFIINVKEADGGRNFSTGMVLNHAANSDAKVPDSGKTSKYIKVPVTDEGVLYHISEIIPKEYTPSSTFLTIVNNKKDGVEVAVLEGDGVRVKPGADAVVIVHNEFEHEDYFHHDASVDNDFTNGLTSAALHVDPEPVNMLSLLPENALLVEREEEKELGEDDRLM